MVEPSFEQSEFSWGFDHKCVTPLEGVRQNPWLSSQMWQSKSCWHFARDKWRL